MTYKQNEYINKDTEVIKKQSRNSEGEKHKPDLKISLEGFNSRLTEPKGHMEHQRIQKSQKEEKREKGQQSYNKKWANTSQI